MIEDNAIPLDELVLLPVFAIKSFFLSWSQVNFWKGTWFRFKYSWVLNSALVWNSLRDRNVNTMTESTKCIWNVMTFSVMLLTHKYSSFFYMSISLIIFLYYAMLRCDLLHFFTKLFLHYITPLYRHKPCTKRGQYISTLFKKA